MRTQLIIILAFGILLILNFSCEDPLNNEPTFQVENSTSAELNMHNYNNGSAATGRIIGPKESAFTGGGGIVDIDSVLFIKGEDTLKYAHYIHEPEAYEQSKDFNLFNSENWKFNGQDYIYTVKQEHFDLMDSIRNAQ